MGQDVTYSILTKEWMTAQQIHKIHRKKYPFLDLGINSIRKNLRYLSKYKVIKKKSLSRCRKIYVYKK